MAKFEKLLSALSEGRSARRDEWEGPIRMYVLGDALVCQRGEGKPWRCALSWDEIVATDWHLVQETKAAEPGRDVLSAIHVAARIPARTSAVSRSKPNGRYTSSTLSFHPDDKVCNLIEHKMRTPASQDREA